MLPQGLEQLESRTTGEHYVEDDQLVVIRLRRGQAAIMVEGSINVKSLGFEETLEETDERVIVVDDEEPVHWIYFAFSRERLR
jgi:hypothetical protein